SKVNESWVRSPQQLQELGWGPGPSTELIRTVDKVNFDNAAAFAALSRGGDARTSAVDVERLRHNVGASLRYQGIVRLVTAGIKTARAEEADRQEEEARLQRDLPGTLGNLTPGYGSVKSSIVQAQHHNYGRAALNAGLAVTDFILVAGIGKLLIKGVA